MEKATQSARDSLWEGFLTWCRQIAIPEETFSHTGLLDVDVVNAILSRYGRALYEAGRPYNHYSETVNAVAGRIPKIRRPFSSRRGTLLSNGREWNLTCTIRRCRGRSCWLW